MQINNISKLATYVFGLISLKVQAVVVSFILASSLLIASPAYAVYTVHITESGGNVTVSGSGSLNFNDLNPICVPCGAGLAGMLPSSSLISVGPSDTINLYNGASSSSGNLGTGGVAFAASGTGVNVQLDGVGGGIGVPNGYVSGDPLGTSTSTFTGTFASLGLTPGTYTWTWGSGANADSFVINIGSVSSSAPPQAIPTLGEWAMIIMASLMALFAIRKVRRQ